MISKNSLCALVMLTLLFASGCSGSAISNGVEKSPEAGEESEGLFNITTDPATGIVSINDEIFISSGNYYHVNLTLIVSGNEGTLIDTGFELPEGQRMKTFIDNNNIILKNIIITHWHNDHTRNIDMFVNGAVNLYDYKNTADGQIIQMGKHTMVVLHTPGHANNEHLSVELNDNVLIAGDVINSSLDPVFVLGFGGNREVLLETLDRLKQRNYGLIVPGHGEIVETSAIIDQHIARLNE